MKKRGCGLFFAVIMTAYTYYTYRVEWSQEDNAHIARCIEFPSLMAHGDTSAAALQEIETVIQETIEWMREENEIVPEPLGQR